MCIAKSAHKAKAHEAYQAPHPPLPPPPMGPIGDRRVNVLWLNTGLRLEGTRIREPGFVAILHYKENENVLALHRYLVYFFTPLQK